MPKEKEISLGDIAKKALDRILELSRSQLISEKLQSMSILLFVFILTAIITYFLVPASSNEVTFGAFIIVDFIFALIISIGYAPVLEAVTNFATKKVEGLRVGLVILLFSLTLAIAALTFRIGVLVTISGVLILVQLLFVAIGGFFFPKIKVTDVEIKPNQIWLALDRISIILGIVSFIIDIILIAISVI